MAAKLRRELETEVEMEHGGYGEFKVVVDRETVIDGGALAALGVVPSDGRIVRAVRDRLGATR